MGLEISGLWDDGIERGLGETLRPSHRDGLQGALRENAFGTAVGIRKGS